MTSKWIDATTAQKAGQVEQKTAALLDAHLAQWTQVCQIVDLTRNIKATAPASDKAQAASLMREVDRLNKTFSRIELQLRDVRRRL